MGELQRAHNKLKFMAERDALTGLYNRGKIEQLINDALDEEGQVSLAMLDLDFFKKINDNHGHDVGDMTLQEIAGIMNTSVIGYEGAQIGRWGGEEFFILLPEMDEEKVMAFAERLRRAVDRHIFPHIGHLTISQGIITVTGGGDLDRKAVYKAVDDALYRAKEDGRNTIKRAAL